MTEENDKEAKANRILIEALKLVIDLQKHETILFWNKFHIFIIFNGAVLAVFCSPYTDLQFKFLIVMFSIIISIFMWLILNRSAQHYVRWRIQGSELESKIRIGNKEILNVFSKGLEDVVPSTKWYAHIPILKLVCITPLLNIIMWNFFHITVLYISYPELDIFSPNLILTTFTPIAVTILLFIVIYLLSKINSEGESLEQ